MILKIIKQLYTGSRFYQGCYFVAFIFVLGFFSDPIYLIAKLCLFFLILTCIIDFSLLFFTGRQIVFLTREIPEKLSNGDENKVRIFIKSNHLFPFRAVIVDEVPYQFQIRDFNISVYLKPHEERQFEYMLKPVMRGEYEFGKTNVFISTVIGFLKRKHVFNSIPIVTPVYPSFLNIRKFEFLAVSNQLTEAGIKRIRRIGQHSEFDQIREYVKGDDYRAINWKTTAKKGKIMTNQYQDERSQQIYCILDMGRVMKMPFERMSLLDYAINSSLVLSNTALQKHDKAGLITFNTEINTFHEAERKSNTIAKFLESLYKLDTRFLESNFEILYITIKRKITHRSLLILFTNFESMVSLTTQLPNLKRLARNHLLLVVIFENTEITEFRKKEVHTLQDIYTQTIADKFIHDKVLMIKELNNHGIHSVLVKPQDLSAKLVNKYLELKARNLI